MVPLLSPSRSARPLPPAPPAVHIASTLPGHLDRLVGQALLFTGVDPSAVTVKVKRHGVRAYWFRACDDHLCHLAHTPADWAFRDLRGPGHVVRRRKDLSRCASPAPTARVEVTSHWVSGRAYGGVPRLADVPTGTRWLITCKVPQVVGPQQFPGSRTYHRAKTAGATRIETPADDLVFVLGHELTHIEQFRTGRPLSEVEAEQAGRDTLARWRAAGRPGARFAHVPTVNPAQAASG